MPTTLTGSLHPSNKDAIAWNEKGNLVYGCHCTLVFVNVARLETFQTLEQHGAAINMVCWRPQKSFLKRNDIELKCASSDISGQIIIWDVLSASVLSTFRNSNSTAIDMKWLVWQDANRDFLLALHSNNSLILWNSDTGERIWEHKFATNVFKFSVDPFESSNIALSSVASNLIFMTDVVVHKAPNAVNQSVMCIRPHDKAGKDSSLIQVQYHLAYTNLVFALFSNEVVCIEVLSKQIIYSALIETNAPLSQIIPCSSRDAFFLIHHNGFITFRVANISCCEERVEAQLTYERACFSEAQRASSRVRVMGSALCPVSQSSIVLMFNSGKLVFYQLLSQDHPEIEPYRICSVEDHIQLTTELQNVYENLRFSQAGLITPLCSTVTTVRMRPMDPANMARTAGSDEKSDENRSESRITRLDGLHLAAIGTSTGTVHLVNVFNGRIELDLQIHTCPVKCLEWGGSNILISAAYSASLSSSSTVRNDVFATDIRTGVKRRIRQEAEESPIELIRVSFYQCYLAISFRSEPLEIWDLKSMRLLRRMSKRCPVIVDMAWSGKHHNIKTVSDTSIYRENLVVLDNDNHLYHVVVKGLHVRDGKEVSTQWKSGATLLRCMVWKDDVLAFGDSAGRLGVWDLVRSQCRQTGLTQSTRGPVLRCVFSRLAGDSTLAVQHPTSVVLWDTERLQPIQQFQHPGLSIIDVDMSGVTPLYIASDGMFRFATENDSRNSPVVDSEIPLLLRSDYCKCISDSINTGAIQPFDAGTNLIDVEDFNYLEQRLESSDDFIDRAIFAYSFLGQTGLSRFAKIAKLGRSENSGLEERQTQSLKCAANLQIFWNSDLYRKRAELLTRVLLNCCKTEKQLERAIEHCIIMGKNDLATYSLLNNDHPINSSDFRLNAFKACLLSSNLRSDESQCLVKLTATNLIASNFISDGIQLLFLIDQGLDACKYLISQSMWMQSIAYAKMHPRCDYEEVLLRYVDYLMNEQVSYKSLAIMLLASLGKWNKCMSLVKLITEPEVNIALVDIITKAAEAKTKEIDMP
ncbi:WD repeat-containing protein 11 [Ditylenchus destructor]|nr:WD repeat-containing protein 11 [Ditylenchus destructor]